jgi:hypothetical protein
MLAFNLGIFFSNLKGADVTFTASNGQCTVQFTGGVTALEETNDLSRHLSVTLGKGELTCHIDFDENEEPEEEGAEEEIVDVRMVHTVDEREVELLQTQFKFDEITLKPHVEGEEAPAEEEPEPPKAG